MASAPIIECAIGTSNSMQNGGGGDGSGIDVNTEEDKAPPSDTKRDILLGQSRPPIHTTTTISPVVTETPAVLSMPRNLGNDKDDDKKAPSDSSKLEKEEEEEEEDQPYRLQESWWKAWNGIRKVVTDTLYPRLLHMESIYYKQLGSLGIAILYLGLTYFGLKILNSIGWYNLCWYTFYWAVVGWIHDQCTTRRIYASITVPYCSRPLPVWFVVGMIAWTGTKLFGGRQMTVSADIFTTFTFTSSDARTHTAIVDIPSDNPFDRFSTIIYVITCTIAWMRCLHFSNAMNNKNPKHDEKVYEFWLSAEAIGDLLYPILLCNTAYRIVRVCRLDRIVVIDRFYPDYGRRMLAAYRRASVARQRKNAKPLKGETPIPTAGLRESNPSVAPPPPPTTAIVFPKFSAPAWPTEPPAVIMAPVRTCVIESSRNLPIGIATNATATAPEIPGPTAAHVVPSREGKTETMGRRKGEEVEGEGEGAVNDISRAFPGSSLVPLVCPRDMTTVTVAMMDVTTNNVVVEYILPVTSASTVTREWLWISSMSALVSIHVNSRSRVGAQISICPLSTTGFTSPPITFMIPRQLIGFTRPQDLCNSLVNGRHFIALHATRRATSILFQVNVAPDTLTPTADLSKAYAIEWPFNLRGHDDPRPWGPNGEGVYCVGTIADEWERKISRMEESCDGEEVYDIDTAQEAVEKARLVMHDLHRADIRHRRKFGGGKNQPDVALCGFMWDDNGPSLLATLRGSTLETSSTTDRKAESKRLVPRVPLSPSRSSRRVPVMKAKTASTATRDEEKKTAPSTTTASTVSSNEEKKTAPAEDVVDTKTLDAITTGAIARAKERFPTYTKSDEVQTAADIAAVAALQKGRMKTMFMPGGETLTYSVPEDDDSNGSDDDDPEDDDSNGSDDDDPDTDDPDRDGCRHEETEDVHNHNIIKVQQAVPVLARLAGFKDYRNFGFAICHDNQVFVMTKVDIAYHVDMHMVWIHHQARKRPLLIPPRRVSTLSRMDWQTLPPFFELFTLVDSMSNEHKGAGGFDMVRCTGKWCTSVTRTTKWKGKMTTREIGRHANGDLIQKVHQTTLEKRLCGGTGTTHRLSLHDNQQHQFLLKLLLRYIPRSLPEDLCRFIVAYALVPPD